MTPQDHNKVIGIMHLLWGGFNALMMLLFVPIFLGMIPLIGTDPHAPPEVKALFGFFALLMFVLALVFGTPPIIAGYAMLKRRSWAKLAGVISACLTALSFPIGTALCVYTLWFLFGEGENFYRAPDASAWRGEGVSADVYPVGQRVLLLYGSVAAWRASLTDAGTFDWEARRASDARQKDYTPPPQPPDWRS